MLSFFKRHKKNGCLPKLPFHTDLHSHVCPGIDDGATSTSIAVNLVRSMSEFGITKMLVTPHVTDEVFPNTPNTIAYSYNKLRRAVSDAGIEMEFGHSAEYRIDELLIKYLENGLIEPLPNEHLLIENAWMQEPYNLDSFIFDLQNKYNLKPILAHPERYSYYQVDRQRYKELHEHGVLFQINLLSLSGYNGKASHKTAEWLIENGYIDFIGSDLHRQAHIESISQYMQSSEFNHLLDISHLIKNDTAFLPQIQ